MKKKKVCMCICIIIETGLHVAWEYEEQNSSGFIQRPKLIKNMQFGADDAINEIKLLT